MRHVMRPARGGRAILLCGKRSWPATHIIEAGRRREDRQPFLGPPSEGFERSDPHPAASRVVR
jgi:hypothetical protein